mmetsp:Transcript_34082/g.108811  ORF Transcript_34082/g.108811 Transcript_34082/m.108811 type:complete len:404 (+) Transcript_34082:130-1341(+)
MPARSAIRCVLAATFAVAAGLRPMPGLSFGSSTLRPLAAAAAPPRRRLRSPPPQLLDPLDWLADQLELRLRARREGKLRRPKRIILVRHGQSEGNVNRTAYQSTPDSQIALTEVGWAQGVVAGLQIRELVKNESIRCFYSPYLRARQTLLALLQAFDSQTVQLSSEPRLREQDFGNFQDDAQMSRVLAERQVFGRFYYRFPDGEAGTDVFDRMASFITYLFRTMTERDYFDDGRAAHEPAAPPPQNYVLVTHGLLMRIFCMCYLRWTVTEFEQVWNPSNCEIWVLERDEGRPTYELRGRWRASPFGGGFTDVKFGKNQTEIPPAHMKRPLISRPVTPGAPDALDGPELAHLRDVPKPRGQRAERCTTGPLTGDAVLAYWLGDREKSEESRSKAKEALRDRRYD